jgi:hypothetical protein
MENNENMHIFQRCGFILTAIVVIATAIVALINSDWVRGGISGASLALYLVVIVLSFISLVVAGFFLILAIIPRDWDFTPYEPEKIRELCKVVKQNDGWIGQESSCMDLDEKVLPTIIGELTEAAAHNRTHNIARYALLQRSLLCVVISVCMLGVLGLVHATIFLTIAKP